jgi:hypothetical protein
MPNPRVWEDADVLDLFAWVDICLLNGIDFKETVTQHLNDARQHRSNDCVTLNWVQVKQKFFDKTDDFANHAGLGKKRLPVAHIIEFGTSSIVGLPRDYKEQIERLVASYNSVHTPEVNRRHSGTSSLPNKPHAILLAPRHRASHANKGDARNGDEHVATKQVGVCPMFSTQLD